MNILSMKNNGIRSLIALTVTIALMLMAPLQSAASLGGVAKAAGKGKYVSDVYTAYGKNEGEAQKVLEDKGYTPVKGSLNAASKTYVMLGYKTTDDKSKAITDIALMNSEGGYSVGDYENVIKEKKKDIASFLNGFMTMVKEYRANYENKDGKAIMVHDMLNNFVEDDSGLKMGDLLLGDTLQDKVGIDESIEAENNGNLPDLVSIIMQGNSMNINTIYTALAMAVGKEKSSMVDTFAETDNDDLIKEAEKKNPGMSESKIKQYLRGKYESTAQILQAEAKEMAKEFREYEKGKLDLEKSDPKELDKEFGETEELKDADDVKNFTDKKEWLETAVLYEAVKNYEGGQFKKGELLQFIMDTEKTDDLERFYPLAASLSKGEKVAKQTLSLKAMIAGDLSDEKDELKAAEEQKEEIEKIEDVSVYEGVDRDLFLTDGSVALTDEAKRKKAEALAVDQDSDSFWDTFTIAAASSWALTGVSFIALIGNKLLNNTGKMANEAVGVFEKAVNANSDTVFSMTTSGRGLINKYGSLEKAFKEIAADSSVSDELAATAYEKAGQVDKALRVGTILKATTIALAIISAGVTIAALLYKSEAELPPVPKYMIDASEDSEGKAVVLNYLAAPGNGMQYISSEKKNKGEYGDTKAYEGAQWLTVYAVKDSSAGKPIAPDFIVQKDKEAPADYDRGMHIIGEKGAADLISSRYMNYSKLEKLKNKNNSVYVFYKTAESDGTASAFSGGTIAVIAFAGIALVALLAILVKRSRRKNGAAA